MNLNSNYKYGSNRHALYKFLLVMKITTILLIITIMQVSAGTFAQKITINKTNASLGLIINEIRKQSNYDFFYSKNILKLAKPITINVKDASAESVLKICFKDQPLEYAVQEKTVLIKEKEIFFDKAVIAPLLKSDIKGTVIDESGKPIPFVSILIKGTNKGTSTDINGNFTLSLATGENEIVVSAIGFESQIIAITNQTRLSITLKESTGKLGEVVVVGYGTQRRANITSSITTVSKESLANRPLSNASQALQGASGVYVNQASGGTPGADDATIRIRGLGTLNNNDPLVLVDGIAYNLRDVNPNDIESISVLKDAAAASIYGNRAANGVVLIKTKTGTRGKASIEYDNSFGQQEATYLPDIIWNSGEDIKLYNQAVANQGSGTPFSKELIDNYSTNYGLQSDKYPSTNWMDVMFRKAFMQQHNVRFSGGSEKALYSVSGGYQDQDGVLIGSGAKKYTLATNLSFDASEKLKFSLNLNTTYWVTDQSPAGSGAVISTAYRMRPFFGSKLANGDFADNWLPLNLLNAQNFLRNPLAMATSGINRNYRGDILANAGLEYSLPFKIKYKANLGVTKRDEDQKLFTPQVLLTNPDTQVQTPLEWNGLVGRQSKSVQKFSENSFNTTFYHSLNYDRTIGSDHNISVLLGNSFERFKVSNTLAYVEGLVSNSVSELSNGSINQRVSSTLDENSLLSFFGRVGYNFKEKYLAEFSFRYDGSSKFAVGKRFGFFPAGSIGWRIDQEEFFKKWNAPVNLLKVRTSWGQLGNQNVANFSYLTTYNNNVGQGYTFGGVNVPGVAGTLLSNPDISWERTTTSNIGLDAVLFDNKLSFGIEYYNKSTTDILSNLIIPAQVGNLTGPATNLYSVRNKGLEVSANYQNKIGELGYSIGGNFNYINNMVVSLAGNQQISGVNIIKEGYSINSFYLLQAEGIFQDAASVSAHALQTARTAPGDLIYKDQDGNNLINGSDRMVTGRTVPRYTYSFTLGANFKGIDFSAFFQGVGDVQTYLTGNGIQPFFNGMGLLRQWATDSWTPTNTAASLPKLTTANGYQENFEGIAGSTWWLRDASFLRLKNIQIGYTLPTSVLEKIGVKKVRVFANGQNLLTFSNLKIVDPERANNSTSVASYPTTKIITGGVSLIF